MNRKRYGKRFLRMIPVILIALLAQCKSGDITVLGVFSKKIGGNGESKMAFASDKTFPVTGTIRDAARNPVIHAGIYVTSGNLMVYRTQSDSSGIYHVPDLKPDVYQFTVAGPGMPVHERSQVVVKKGVDLEHVDFTMKSATKAQ